MSWNHQVIFHEYSILPFVGLHGCYSCFKNSLCCRSAQDSARQNKARTKHSLLSLGPASSLLVGCSKVESCTLIFESGREKRLLYTWQEGEFLILQLLCFIHVVIHVSSIQQATFADSKLEQGCPRLERSRAKLPSHPLETLALASLTLASACANQPQEIVSLEHLLPLGPHTSMSGKVLSPVLCVACL